MHKIPFNQLNLVSKLVIDYLQLKPETINLYNYAHELENYEKLINQHSITLSQRELLVNTLLTQYENCQINFSDSCSVKHNILSLRSANTFTITTGHQLVLAGGPLYVAFKILTTIKICNDLQLKYPQYKFVPLLWLATEDHDFEEISEIFLFNKTFKWQILTNNKPTGSLPSKTLEHIVSQLSVLINKNERGAFYTDLLNQCYLNSESLSQASIKWYHALFQKFGLVVLDPNQKALKAGFTDVFKKDILEGITYNEISKTNQYLESYNYKPQINVRHINTFFIHETYGRKLIKKTAAGFSLVDTDIEFTKDEIENLIQTQPELFSPNVCLRPIYQERILPNLAYVGGPAEVAYWLQLKGVFDAYQINMPVVVLRFMALLLGSNLKNKIQKTGLELKYFLGSEEILKKEFLKINRADEIHQAANKTLDAFQNLIDLTKEIDMQTAKELIETKLSIKDFFEQKKKAIAKKILESQDTEFLKLMKIKHALMPKQIFQERIETLMQFECMFNKELLDTLLENVIENADYLTVLEF